MSITTGTWRLGISLAQCYPKSSATDIYQSLLLREMTQSWWYGLRGRHSLRFLLKKELPWVWATEGTSSFQFRCRLQGPCNTLSLLTQSLAGAIVLEALPSHIDADTVEMWSPVHQDWQPSPFNSVAELTRAF